MGGSSGGGTQVQESDSEKALTEVSLAKANRYNKLYKPVEKQFIKQSQQDASALLQGKSQADIAQASSGSIGKAIQIGRGGGGELGTTAAMLGDARITGVTAANKTAQELKDKGGISALRVGSDLSADSQSGMAAAARASNSEAIAKAKAQGRVNDSKMAMFGQIAMGAAQGKLHKMGADKLAATRDATTLAGLEPRGRDPYRRTS